MVQDNARDTAHSLLDMIVFRPGDLITKADIGLVKSLIIKGATDEQLAGFVLACNETGLNPFKRQVYAIPFKRKEGDHWVTEYATVTGIGGYRALAERTGLYDGQDPPQFCGEDGIWKDVWFGAKPPAAARTAVYRKGSSRPVYGIALWSEVAKRNEKGEPEGFWAKMPIKMLGKSSEADALKRAFPDAIANIGFAADEPEQIIDITPRPVIDRATAMKDMDEFYTDQDRTRERTASKSNPAASPVNDTPSQPLPHQEQGPTSTRGPEPADPNAATPAQVKLIRVLGKKQGWSEEDTDAAVEQYYGAVPFKLTKARASEVITELKNLKPANDAGTPAVIEGQPPVEQKSFV